MRSGTIDGANESHRMNDARGTSIGCLHPATPLPKYDSSVWAGIFKMLYQALRRRLRNERPEMEQRQCSWPN